MTSDAPSQGTTRLVATGRKRTKVCIKCNHELSLDKFRDISYGTGPRKRTECKACEGLSGPRRRVTPEGRAHVIMAGIRQRTKRANLPEITVTYSWVLKQIIRGRCAVTNIPFELDDGQGREKVNPYTPSADRIDPSKGYTYRNTDIVVWAYNRAKGEYADSTFARIAHCYLEQKGYKIEEPH